jgi:inhibitor of cysteine peptidase
MRLLVTLMLLGVVGFIAAFGSVAAASEKGGHTAYAAVSGQADRGTTETVGKEAGRLVSNQESIDKGSAGDRVEVTVGQEFSITLASNVTTGYHWELAAALDEAMVQLVGSEYKAPESRLAGAGGQEIWTFRAVGQGQTLINLKYVRPWEKDVAPNKTATYMVVIQ